MEDRLRSADHPEQGEIERGSHVEQRQDHDWQDSGFQDRSSLEPSPSHSPDFDSRGYVGSAWCAEGTLGQPAVLGREPEAEAHDGPPPDDGGEPGERPAVEVGGDGGRGARQQPAQADVPIADLARPFLNKGPRGYVRRDERIWEDVCDELAAGYLDASNVEVFVRDGVVELRGFVTDQRARRRAEELAAGCRGVRGLDNQLCVRGRGVS